MPSLEKVSGLPARAAFTIGESSGNSEGHVAAMGLSLVLFRLNDRVHDSDDFPMGIEQSASRVAATGGEVRLDQACLDGLKKGICIP